MSKQTLSDFAKKRGRAFLLLAGVFVFVAAVMVLVTREPSDSKQPGPIDLNQEPTGFLSAEKDPINNQGEEIKDIGAPVDVNKVTPGPTQVIKPTTTPAQPTKALVSDSSTDGKVKDNAKQEVVEQPVKPVIKPSAQNLEFDVKEGISWPITGKVIMPYCVDKTVYYETLKQFSVNKGMLIQADLGAKITASVTGIITDIKEDVKTGHTITMDIGSDYQLVYGQMEKTKWHVGDQVKEGAVIGNIAKPTKYFTLEGPHLYFQVIHEKETMDPMLLIKEDQ